MSQDYSQEQYNKDFKDIEKKKTAALKHALDIRKFEIELYWKRATYFWTFIGATLAAYGVVQASSSISIETKNDLSIILTCLGIVFSFGWFCVNKGSKQWQENWENHVDLLEDDVTGPLYKVTLRRPKPKGIKWISHLITGPYKFSVSKINQMISLYVTFLWIFLLIKSLTEFRLEATINWGYVVIGLTVLTCIGFFRLGKTDVDSFTHHAHKRESKIDSSA
ncbi:MAG: hypothetical protein WAV28_06510 [Sedimentisphaerales bacterium]